METTKKLIMSFLKSDDRKVSLSVDNPRAVSYTHLDVYKRQV